MSTRAYVGYKNEDGFIDWIYCHFDGYPSHMIPVLERYSNLEKAKELIKMGDASSLEGTLDECVFYHRDYNEDLKVGRNTPYPFLLAKAKKSFIDYVYVFEDNCWKYQAT